MSYSQKKAMASARERINGRGIRASAWQNYPTKYSKTSKRELKRHTQSNGRATWQELRWSTARTMLRTNNLPGTKEEKKLITCSDQTGMDVQGTDAVPT